jgi:hypothetical protein
MEMNKPTIVGLTAVVFIIIAGAITLKALHEDITIIITLVSVLVAPVLLAFGVKVHEGMQEIKHNTNGNNQRQTEFLQQNQLAQQESNQKFQAAMQENVLQLQKMMAEIALATMPPPPAIQAEISKDPSDHPSSVHLP